MANIHGLGNVKNDKKVQNSEEFSVGGAQSGTAVYRPVKGEPQPGDSLNDMQDIVGQARRQADTSPARDRNIGIITLYKNGFRIGEGEFRDSKSPENQRFVQSLKNGDVPSELEAEVKKEWGNIDAVGVHLVDKSSEIYVPSKNAPPPKFDFSKSKGHSMTNLNSSQGQSATTGFGSAKSRTYTVDESQPTTEVSITLHSRTRVKQRFNQSATVLQLYEHIIAISNQTKFELLAGFPPKALTNPSQTLKDASLLSANVQQRLTK